jgi:tRNA(fMet)-specific endonuclease VapC
VSYLIDANIAIHAGAKNPSVLLKFKEHAGSIVISALTLVELQRGLYRRVEDRATRQEQLRILLQQFPVLSFDEAAAEAYGRIIAQCGWTRDRERDRRLMTAAHVISMSAVLVTNNEADFRDIPGLKIENWTKD